MGLREGTGQRPPRKRVQGVYLGMEQARGMCSVEAMTKTRIRIEVEM